MIANQTGDFALDRIALAFANRAFLNPLIMSLNIRDKRPHNVVISSRVINAESGQSVVRIMDLYQH